jgi:exosortase
MLSLRIHWLSLATFITGLGILFIFQIYHAAFGLMPAALLGLALGTLLVVMANLHYLFGFTGMCHSGFGFAFILIALPMPSAIQGPVVASLQVLVSTLDVEILSLLGIPAQLKGSLISLPEGTVGIDEACSGIRSVQSTIMATLFIGYLALRGWGLRIVLFVAGMFLAILGNVIRSLVLSYTANAKGVAALASLHDPASWSILVFTVVGVGLVAWVLNRIEKE